MNGRGGMEDASLTWASSEMSIKTGTFMLAAMAVSGAFLVGLKTRNPAAKLGVEDRLEGAVGRKRNRNKLCRPAAADTGTPICTKEETI